MYNIIVLLIFIFRFLFRIRAIRLSRQFVERSFSWIRRFYRKPLPYFWNHAQGENYSSKWKFIAALYARARTTVIAIMALSRLTSPTGVRYYAVRGFGSKSRGRDRPTEHTRRRIQCTRLKHHVRRRSQFPDIIDRFLHANLKPRKSYLSILKTTHRST